MRKTQSIEYKLLFFLMMFMPFQYYICTLLLKNIQIDNLFRDFVLIILLILLAKKRIRVNKVTLAVFINIVGLILSAVFTMLFHRNGMELERLRLYLLPILIYFVTSRIKISEEKYEKLNRAQLNLFSIISIYGIFQAFVLGQSFLIRLGYRTTESGAYLYGSAFFITGLFGLQRVVALFNSPNLAGALFAIFSTILICLKSIKRTVLYYLVLGILLLGLIATFSRSSIIGFVIACVCIFGKKFKTKISIKFLKRLFLIFIVILFLFALIDIFVSKGVFAKMFNYLLQQTISREDHSLQKHIRDLYEPLEVILKNPFGRSGFGDNGPIALLQSPTSLNVESSIYLMIYEEGILFGLLFFLPYIFAIYDGIRHRKTRRIETACICIICMFQYFILPTVQTYEMLFYSYAYIGFYYNESLNNITHNKSIL